MNIKQIIFFNFSLAIIFSSLMGFAMLAINVGFIPGFFMLFLKSFGIGMVVSLPIAFIIVGPVMKLTLKFFNEEKKAK
jgi:hypothetical protein